MNSCFPLNKTGILLFFADFPKFSGPFVDILLPGAGHRQSIFRYILGNNRAGSHIGPLPDMDRRDQTGVTAHKSVIPNGSAVLLKTVIITSNGTASDVAMAAHITIADISEVGYFGAVLHNAVFNFHKVPYFYRIAQLSFGSQVSKGTDIAVISHLGLDGNALPKAGVIPKLAIAYIRLGSDQAISADAAITPYCGKGLYNRVRSNLG